MRRGPRRAIAIVATGGAVGVLALVAAAAPREPPAGRDPPGRTLAISGSVSDLYPGVSVTLPVRVENPFSYTIEIIDLSVLVGDASSDCPGSDVAVSGFAPAVIASRSTAQVVLAVELAPTSANSCQGATFPLRYTATARRT